MGSLNCGVVAREVDGKDGHEYGKSNDRQQGGPQTQELSYDTDKHRS